MNRSLGDEHVMDFHPLKVMNHQVCAMENEKKLYDWVRPLGNQYLSRFISIWEDKY